MYDFIIIGVFATVILWVIGYVLVNQMSKFMKWSLEIQIPRKIYHFWDIVSWSLTLKTKKDIDSAWITLDLILRERQNSYAAGRSRSRSVEIKRYSIDIAGPKKYLSWDTEVFSFELLIPLASEIPEIQESLGRFKIMRWYYNRVPKLQKYVWSLWARVNCDGVDITSRTSLRVNQNPNNWNI
jgi:hypothetical protein